MLAIGFLITILTVAVESPPKNESSRMANVCINDDHSNKNEKTRLGLGSVSLNEI